MHVPVTDLTRSVRPYLGETRRLFALTRWVPRGLCVECLEQRL
jgi:hypothetical protein